MPLETILALAAAANRLTELIKKLLLVHLVGLSDGARSIVTLVVSLLVGVLSAFGAQVNLFAGETAYANLPPTIGVIFTGLVIGLGANVIDVVYDVLYGYKVKQQTPDALVLRE